MPLLSGKIYSPSVFFAGLRIDQFELLYVNRRIGTERKRLPILIFQLFQKVRIIIFQAGKNRGIHDDTNLEPFFTLFPLSAMPDLIYSAALPPEPAPLRCRMTRWY